MEGAIESGIRAAEEIINWLCWNLSNYKINCKN